MCFPILYGGPSLSQNLGEAKTGAVSQTSGFPTLFGKGPDCVADPFGTVPCRCC